MKKLQYLRCEREGVRWLIIKGQIFYEIVLQRTVWKTYDGELVTGYPTSSTTDVAFPRQQANATSPTLYVHTLMST